jgi:hypothetical protein
VTTLNVAQKMDNVEIIEITTSRENRQQFELKFFMFKSTSTTKMALSTINPVVLNTLDEVRGFLIGFSSITGIEFFVTDVRPNFMQLTGWPRICISGAEVCFIEKEKMTPKDLTNYMFKAKIEKSLL